MKSEQTIREGVKGYEQRWDEDGRRVEGRGAVLDTSGDG